MYPAGVAGIRTSFVTPPRGGRLRVLECGPGDGTPVLLIHGWGACVYTFRFALEALGSAGYRAIAFDARGHGLSDKPVGRGQYTTAALVADVQGLLNCLGIRHADVVGHSLGGGVALHLALAHPDRVRRLILAAPVGLTHIGLREVGHLLTPRVTDRFARYLTPRWLTALLLRSTYGDPRRASDADIDEYWAPSQFPNYYRAARALLEEFTWRPLTNEELERIGSSTLVILSGADRLIRGAEPVAQRIPRLRLACLDGAGHLGIEECSAEFNRELVAFLDSS
jgi:pimeloyl-ACP methyl ester carboxylesterase